MKKTSAVLLRCVKLELQERLSIVIDIANVLSTYSSKRAKAFPGWWQQKRHKWNAVVSDGEIYGLR